jgi:hypothetical protein
LRLIHGNAPFHPLNFDSPVYTSGVRAELQARVEPLGTRAVLPVARPAAQGV